MIEFPLVVKADVQGSAEAIVTALHAISNDDIKVRILHSGVGAITESDVTLGFGASGAPIIGFGVRPNAKARELIERNKTRMKYFDVIYDLTDDIRAEMAGELGPEKIEHVVGRAEVKEVFPAGKKDKAAGLLVMRRLHSRRVFTPALPATTSSFRATTIASLRRFKDDVDEVRAGLECGVVLADTNDIKPNDMLEVFEIEERERVLCSPPAGGRALTMTDQPWRPPGPGGRRRGRHIWHYPRTATYGPPAQSGRARAPHPVRTAHPAGSARRDAQRAFGLGHRSPHDAGSQEPPRST